MSDLRKCAEQLLESAQPGRIYCKDAHPLIRELLQALEAADARRERLSGLVAKWRKKATRGQLLSDAKRADDESLADSIGTQAFTFEICADELAAALVG